MRRDRAITAVAYLVVTPLLAYAATQELAGEGTWLALIVCATLVTGAVVGGWSVGLVALLAAAMILVMTLRPCDPAVAYSCDPSVDPWWPPVLFNTVLLSVVFAIGAALGGLVPAMLRLHERRPGR